MAKKSDAKRTLNETEVFEIVLGGGGVKGFGHLGFLRAIEESDLSISHYTGVSIGSVVGAFYTNGFTPDEIDEIFREEVFKIKPERLIRALIPGQAGFGIEPIIRELVEKYDLKPQDNLRIIAYNVLQRTPVVFEGTDYDLATAVAASCSIPVVMKPVWKSRLPSGVKRYLEHASGEPSEGLLVDGGVYHPCPVEFCEAPVIVSKLGFATEPPKEVLGFTDYYFYMAEWSASRLLNRIYPDPDAHLLIDCGLPHVSSLSFGVTNRTQDEMIDHGYTQTVEALASLTVSTTA